MKVSFLIGTLFFLVVSCNKVENKPIEDYKVIETDYLIIKSKFDFKESVMSLKSSPIQEKIISKDSLKCIILETDDGFVLQIIDEKFINNDNELRKIDKYLETEHNLKPKVYFDTIIDSKKIDLSESRINSDIILNAKMVIDDNYCCFISLVSSEKKYKDDKNAFFEILEGTTIKQ